MTPRFRSVRRARRQRAAGRPGFIVTWDVDARDSSQCARVRRFIFGYTLHNNGKVYRYKGFVEREEVRYLGQSVLFVTEDALAPLRRFLRSERVGHVITDAWLGSVMPS